MVNILGSVFSLTLVVVFLTTFSISSLAQNSDLQNMATNIFNDKILTVPNKVKNFIVLIPNEAHESPILPKEQRLINQPYVPQNLVVGPKTNIIWFSGDVGHSRKVTLTDDNSKEIFDSTLKFNSASKPLSINQSGKFTYHEEHANSQDPDFVMEGTITIASSDSPSNISNNVNDTQPDIDTMAVLMVPTEDIRKHSEIIDKNNINILDQYTFKDLRETGSGGKNQTLLVLGSNNPPDETIAVLKKITSTLPYS
ncbi:MAG TPA: hypothetical protein VIA08_00375 [Nitrososphaeraceae archaeon]